MAPPDKNVPSSGTPVTTPSGTTSTVGGTTPIRDRAPSLAVCINSRGALPARAEGELKVGGRPKLDHLKAIIDDMCASLAGRRDDVWDLPEGKHPKAADPSFSEPEELWARRVDELFLGCAYGGPNITASFPDAKRGGKVTSSIEYIFGRFAMENGKPPNDPAYSLVVACQFLVTYGLLARGVPRASVPGGGVAANQSTGALPLFGKNGTGQFWSSDDVVLPPRKTAVASKKIAPNHAFDPGYLMGLSGSAGTFTPPYSGGSGPDMTEDAMSGFGPGALYLYNPLGYRTCVIGYVPTTKLLRPTTIGQTGLPLCNLEAAQNYLRQEQAENDAANLAEEDLARRSNAATQGSGMPPVKPTKTEIEDKIAADEAEDAAHGPATVRAEIPVVVQLEGSHASMVVRSYVNAANLPVVQMLDTADHAGPADSKTTYTQMVADYVAFEPAGRAGIYTGEAFAQVPNANIKHFVGMGTVAPISDRAAVDDLTKSARPVGLARLVLAPRDAAVDEEALYFVSPMIPMWTASGDNIPIWRLLWSLRRSLYWQDVQAYWIVYAPRGALAEVMWEEGARSLTLHSMADEAITRANTYKDAKATTRTRLHTRIDLECVTVLSSNADGLAQQVWRNHGNGGQGTVANAIRKLFTTGAADPTLIDRKTKELQKAYLDEIDRRKARQAEVIKSAAKTDTYEVVKQKIDAIWAEPFPEKATYEDYGSTLGTTSDKYAQPVLLVRDNPLASLLHPSIAAEGSLELHPLFTAHCPDSFVANKPSDGG